jgi:Tfp pilus assembly protein PilN
MRQLGIRPASITVGAVALANMFLGTQHDGRNKTFILADLKAAGFELAILRGGTVIYTHEGARQGGAPWKQVLQQEMEIGISKVRLDPEETIEGIIVAGESSPGALQEIGEDLPGCEPIGKRLRFEMTLQNRGHLQEAATSLGLAYSGLSRRPPMKLNLLPPDQRVQQKTWAYIPTVILGLALVAALGGLVLHKSIQERMLVQELDRAVDGLKGQVDHINALRLQAEDQERQVASLEQVLGRRDQNLEILLELTNMFPADTYLQMYNNNDCSITITGQTPPAAQFDFISKLEKSPLLRDVSSTSATFRNQQSGKDVFTFTAKCEK